MKETKDRLVYIDMIKGFSMLCIILGHLIPNNYALQCIVCSFHVPIYYIISGFLMKYHEEQKRKEKMITTIKKTTKNLIIPYFFFSFIHIAVIWLEKRYSYAQTLLQFTLNFSGIAALWLIPSFAIAKVVLTGIVKIKNKFIQAVIILLILSLFITQIPLLKNMKTDIIYRSITAIILMAVGYYCYSWIKKANIPMVALLLAIILGFYISYLNGPFVVYNLTNNYILLALALAIIISICIILIFKKIPNLKILEFCGRNSIILLGTHQLAIIYLKWWFRNIPSELNSIIFAISFIVSEIIIVYICNHYLPFFIR